MSTVPREHWQLAPDEPWEEVEISTDFTAFWAPAIPDPDSDGVIADDGCELVDERDDIGAGGSVRLPPMRSVTVVRQVHFKLAGIPMMRTFTVIASQPRPSTCSTPLTATDSHPTTTQETLT
jgi:hypothetical protein